MWSPMSFIVPMCFWWKLITSSPVIQVPCVWDLWSKILMENIWKMKPSWMTLRLFHLQGLFIKSEVKRLIHMTMVPWKVQASKFTVLPSIWPAWIKNKPAFGSLWTVTFTTLKQEIIFSECASRGKRLPSGSPLNLSFLTESEQTP
jgi:hypothetical protein